MNFYDRCKKYIIIAAAFGTFTITYNIIAESKPNAYEVSLGSKVIVYLKEDIKSLDTVKSVAEEVDKRFDKVNFKDSLVISKVKVPDDYIISEKDIRNTIIQNSRLEVDSFVMQAGGKELGIVASEDEGRQVLDKLKDYYVSASKISIKDSKVKTHITYVEKKSLVNNVDNIDSVVDRIKEANSKLKTPIVAFELKGSVESKEAVAPSTKVTVSKSIPAGQSKVQSKGEEGQKLVVKEVTLENSKIINTKKVSEKIIIQPKDKVVLQGYKAPAVAGSTYLTTPSRGAISSYFGARWGRMHEGIDIAANTGDPIYAAVDGTVTYSGWMSGYGNFIKLKHANGLETAYGHCSKLNVSVGQSVKKGQKIGEVGSTGNSTGPHLHFEVLVNGVPKNPIGYIQ